MVFKLPYYINITLKYLHFRSRHNRFGFCLGRWRRKVWRKMTWKVTCDVKKNTPASCTRVVLHRGRHSLALVGSRKFRSDMQVKYLLYHYWYICTVFALLRHYVNSTQSFDYWKVLVMFWKSEMFEEIVSHRNSLHATNNDSKMNEIKVDPVETWYANNFDTFLVLFSLHTCWERILLKWRKTCTSSRVSSKSYLCEIP